MGSFRNSLFTLGFTLFLFSTFCSMPFNFLERLFYAVFVAAAQHFSLTQSIKKILQPFVHPSLKPSHALSLSLSDSLKPLSLWKFSVCSLSVYWLRKAKMASEGGNLKSTSINGMKVYSLASQNRSHASWLDPKKLRALRKDKSNLLHFSLSLFWLPFNYFGLIWFGG